DPRPARGAARDLDDRRRHQLQLRGRPRAARAALDAEDRPRVVVAPDPGAAPAGAALPDRRHPLPLRAAGALGRAAPAREAVMTAAAPAADGREPGRRIELAFGAAMAGLGLLFLIVPALLARRFQFATDDNVAAIA